MAKLLVSVRNSGNRSLAHINPQIRKFCPTSLLWIAIQIANVRTISKYAIKSSKLILCHQLGSCDQFSSVQSLSHVWLFETPIDYSRPGMSITNSQRLLRLISIESVMPSKLLILCCPFSSCLQSFLALGSLPVSQFFTSGGVSASASVLPMNIQDWFPLGLTGLICFEENQSPFPYQLSHQYSGGNKQTNILGWRSGLVDLSQGFTTTRMGDLSQVPLPTLGWSFILY